MSRQVVRSPIGDAVSSPILPASSGARDASESVSIMSRPVLIVDQRPSEAPVFAPSREGMISWLDDSARSWSTWATSTRKPSGRCSRSRSGPARELLGKVAVRMGLVKEDQVLKALGEQLGMKVVKLADITIPAELTELVNESMATAYKIVPVSQNKKDKSLTVAMAEPQNPSTLDSLRMFLSTEVKGAIATEADVMAAIERLYAGHHESIQDVVKQIEQDKGLAQMAGPQREHDRPRGDRGDGRGRAGAQAPEHGAAAGDQGQGVGHPLRAVRGRVQDAVPGGRRALRAGPAAAPPGPGDLQPHQGHVEPRHRRAPAAAGRPDPARPRRQRGRHPGLDLADACSARAWSCGSSTGRSSSSTSRSSACPKTRSSTWHEIVEKPNGIILVTGPTSSGKTTTLYATLNELNRIEDKIITTEEPVEYDIEGLIQIPINPEIGVTFAACLRSILRQDPDKILVGETRDLETAEISIQASLTGHIVFTTLHTNDAPSAITRLRDMGLPTFLITATVEAVLAQRLVRKICTELPDRVHPGPRGLHGAGHDRRSRRRPRSSSTARDARSAITPATRAGMGIYELLGHERHPPRDGRLRGLARRFPRRLPQVRHADPPRDRA